MTTERSLSNEKVKKNPIVKPKDEEALREFVQQFKSVASISQDVAKSPDIRSVLKAHERSAN